MLLILCQSSTVIIWVVGVTHLLWSFPPPPPELKIMATLGILIVAMIPSIMGFFISAYLKCLRDIINSNMTPEEKQKAIDALHRSTFGIFSTVAPIISKFNPAGNG
jgi:hypothetical protein